MYRTCPICEKQFFRGGRMYNSKKLKCPECKFKAKRKKQIKREENRKYDTTKVIRDFRGNIVSEDYDSPIRNCEFCGEEYRIINKTQKYCRPCSNARPRSDHYCTKCEACGKTIWSNVRNKHHFCDDTCKQMLRKHIDCKFCGDFIDAKKPLSTAFCQTSCREAGWKRVKTLREDRDGKGSSYTPKMRYDILIEIGARQSILDEFKEDLI